MNAHGTKVGCKALVVQTLLHPIIISLTNCKKLGLVHPEFPMPYKPQKVIAQTANISIEAESIKARLSREFKQIITDTISEDPMAGPPMAINIKQGAKPTRRLTARTIPQAMKKEADAQIRKMLKNKVIAPVDHATDWISPGFFVQKPNGGVRLVTDFTNLNTHVNRPVYPFPCTREILQDVPPSAKVFAKLDTVQGTSR